MTPKVQKRAAAAAVHPRADETSVPGNGASGAAGGADAKTGGGAPPAPNPWPAEYGWDFPFDFPKRGQ
ncbi:MAG TPA: hypothetical protein VGG79_19415 [Roseiarcus sp.]|jgi:hypothetical protein